MKFARLRRLLLSLLALFALAYVAAAAFLAFQHERLPVLEGAAGSYETLAIFGASGTAGDGILKAALADPAVRRIHVVTRRTTPRIEAGIAAGKVQMTLHRDYLDYTAVREQIAAADAVYWAIGTSSLGVDEASYAQIHVDFPARFLTEWLQVSNRPGPTFHYISSSDISADSGAMWARQKYRAEETLTSIAEGTNLRVILYRPDYIGPTAAEAHVGQDLLYGFFAPLGAAVRAEEIGRAMLETTARPKEFANGDRLSTRKIILYGEAYARRQAGLKD